MIERCLRRPSGCRDDQGAVCDDRAPTAMIERLARTLRDPPVLPALAAIALLIAWAANQAGYPLTHWAPGGLVVLALLGIALIAARPPLRPVPVGVKLALGALGAYGALSFCSIVWAGVPGDAWEGADRTLLYVLLFALFAIWGARGAAAALLLCTWTLAMTGLAAYVAVRVGSTTGASFERLFAGERLDYPAGYPNADAALWLIAFWPALVLASAGRLPSPLRGLLAGGAVLLADVALFSQSRGSLYAMVVVLALVFALIPLRLRLFATLVPVALGVGATAPLVLRVGERIHDGSRPYSAAHAAVALAFVAALLVGFAVGLAAAAERRSGRALARATRRMTAVAASATLLGVIVAGLVLAGDPIARAHHAWDSFKSGYSTHASSQTRLLGGLGSNRYDFYRVALDQFVAHPLLGIGADNYAQQYLAHRHSEETPRYPHSLELRVLAQTGALGAALLLLALGGGLVSGWHAMRRRDDPLAEAVAAAALAGFAYWTVHGSFDWFWEFAGLGGAAFALLGIACSLVPHPTLVKREQDEEGTARAASPHTASQAGPHTVSQPGARRSAVARRGMRRRCTPRRLALALPLALATLAAALAFAAPWLSEREVASAARIWRSAPLSAYARLQDAARLNPLSDRPYLVAGSIALRFGDTTRARSQFSAALKRVPDDAYATLELGAISSAQGERRRALELLGRAFDLNPRDPLPWQALRVVRAGRRVSVAALNEAILRRAQGLS